MITLHKMARGMSIPQADYVLEKPDKLLDIISNLTPKFQGKWEIILIDPKVSFTDNLVANNSIPDWIHVSVYMNTKKIDMLAIKYPELQPKDISKRDVFNSMLTELKHVIDEKAKHVLFDALSSNVDELKETLDRLDAECETSTITLKQVQQTIPHNKRVYASEVLNAFIYRDRFRWNLYNKLIKEIGQDMAFYAMRKYATKLLTEKEAYLRNEDVKNFRLGEIDAPTICYIYTLFANANNPNQLYNILYAIEYRNEYWLNTFIKDDDLK